MMNTSKKAIVSIAWLAAFLMVCGLVQVVRNIGTEWKDEAGFLRVLGLVILSIGTLVPLAFAVLVWFDQPKKFYKKH